MGRRLGQSFPHIIKTRIRLILRVHIKLRAGELRVPPLRFPESNSSHALGFHGSIKSEGKKLVTDRVARFLYCQVSPLKKKNNKKQSSHLKYFIKVNFKRQKEKKKTKTSVLEKK